MQKSCRKCPPAPTPRPPPTTPPTPALSTCAAPHTPLPDPDATGLALATPDDPPSHSGSAVTPLTTQTPLVPCTRANSGSDTAVVAAPTAATAALAPAAWRNSPTAAPAPTPA